MIERPRPEQQASINALLHSGDKYSRRATHLSQQNSLDSRPSSNNRRRTRHTSSRAAPTSNDQPSDFQEGLSDDIIPKLRGGCGGEKHTHTGGCDLTLKQLLLVTGLVMAMPLIRTTTRTCHQRGL